MEDAIGGPQMRPKEVTVVDCHVAYGRRTSLQCELRFLHAVVPPSVNVEGHFLIGSTGALASSKILERSLSALHHAVIKTMKRCRQVWLLTCSVAASLLSTRCLSAFHHAVLTTMKR